MKLHRLTLHGIGPFRGLATLDLDALPAGLIALVGANGAGKSTALECVPAALYRTLPTRGTLAELATGRDSYVELDVTTSRGRVRIRQTIDNVSGKAEALVLDATGAPLLPTTSVRAYDAWAADALPAPEVYLSSLFAAQGSGGFLDLPTADRKRVILSALRCGRLEQMSKVARDRAATRRAELTTLSARIDAERGRADVAGAEQVVAQAERDEDERAFVHGAAIIALDAARADHAALVAAHADAVKARREAAEATQRVARARDAVRAVGDRQEAARTVVKAGAAVTAAAAALPDLEAREVQARGALATAEAELRTAETSARELRATIESAGRECKGLFAERTRLGEATRQAAEIRQAAALHDLTAMDVLRAKSAEEAAEAALDAARAVGTQTAEQRIDGLRGGFYAIQASPNDATEITTTTLFADDRAALDAAEGPERVRVAVEARNAAGRALLAAMEAHRACVDAVRAIPALDRDEARLSEVEGLAQNASLRATTAQESLAGWERSATRLGAEVRERRAAHDAALSALLDARRTAARAPEIAAAAARLEELTAARVTADAELTAAVEAARHTPEPPAEPPLPPDLSALEATATAALAAHREAERVVTRAEQALEAARAAAALVETLADERSELEESIADHVRLSDDLGQRGLIALEVDAVGPELSELASALLRACFGPRWTVSIQTTRPRADGAGETEVFEVRVLDTLTGTDGPVERLSGGERVIVGEAVALALTTLSTRRAGLTGSTLIRDESGAALDAERGPAYVAMLRRAAALVGAERVLLVTHSQDLHPLCDARVRVEGGAFHVEQ